MEVTLHRNAKLKDNFKSGTVNQLETKNLIIKLDEDTEFIISIDPQNFLVINKVGYADGSLSVYPRYSNEINLK